MADLGRYQRGRLVHLGIIVPAPPDTFPEVEIADPDGNPVETLRLPLRVQSEDLRAFGWHYRLAGGLTLGTYSATYTYAVAGVSGSASDTFDVVPGGDSGGAVIALYGSDRPEGRVVLAQLDGGKLALGRNPHL